MSSDTTNPVTDEIDLRDILRPLWLGKWRILLWGLLFTLITAIYQLGGISLDKSERAQMQVHFNFSGAEQGLYPNDSSFSPLELLSDPVLRAVYSRHFDESVTFTDFDNALTLIPNFIGASTLENLVAKLAAQDKGLSVAEFNAAVEAYSVTLTSQSMTNATVQLNLAIVGGNLAKASDILSDIADTWATQAINVRGVLNLKAKTINSQIIASTDEDLLISVNILADTHSLLTKATAKYSADTQLSDLADPATGYTLADLAHMLSNEGQYKVAILKEMIIKSGSDSDGAIWYQGFRQARVAELQRKRDALERMVTVYNDALMQFSQREESPSQTGAGQGQSSPQIYSPQYSNDLVNTLLELGSKMSDPEYRKELLEAKIGFSSDLQAVITEIEFYQSARDNNEASLDMAKMSQLITDSSKKLAGINDALSGLIGVANTWYLADNGELYDLQGAISYVTTDSLTGRLKLKLILAFIMGLAIGVVVVFVKLLVAPTAPTIAAKPSN